MFDDQLKCGDIHEKLRFRVWFGTSEVYMLNIVVSLT